MTQQPIANTSSSRASAGEITKLFCESYRTKWRNCFCIAANRQNIGVIEFQIIQNSRAGGNAQLDVRLSEALSFIRSTVKITATQTRRHSEKHWRTPPIKNQVHARIDIHASTARGGGLAVRAAVTANTQRPAATHARRPLGLRCGRLASSRYHRWLPRLSVPLTIAKSGAAATARDHSFHVIRIARCRNCVLNRRMTLASEPVTGVTSSRASMARAAHERVPQIPKK